MAIPVSGNTISILQFAREKVYDDCTDDRPPYTGGNNKHPYPLDGYTWVTTGNNCTLSRDTGVLSPVNDSTAGGGSLKMVCSGTDSYTSSHGTSFNHGTAGIGQTWTFSVYAKASTSLTGQLFLFEAPDGGSYSAFSYENKSITTSWQRFEITRTLNQASTETVRVRCDGPDASSTATIYWDGFQIEQASSATTFSMNGPYTMLDLVVGGNDYGSTVDFEETNTNSSFRPNELVPHTFYEWYSYDHDDTGCVLSTAAFISGNIDKNILLDFVRWRVKYHNKDYKSNELWLGYQVGFKKMATLMYRSKWWSKFLTNWMILPWHKEGLYRGKKGKINYFGKFVYILMRIHALKTYYMEHQKIKILEEKYKNMDMRTHFNHYKFIIKNQKILKERFCGY